MAQKEKKKGQTLHIFSVLEIQFEKSFEFDKNRKER
jgi:hypothetical protein